MDSYREINDKTKKNTHYILVVLSIYLHRLISILIRMVYKYKYEKHTHCLSL